MKGLEAKQTRSDLDGFGIGSFSNSLMTISIGLAKKFNVDVAIIIYI